MVASGKKYRHTDDAANSMSISSTARQPMPPPLEGRGFFLLVVGVDVVRERRVPPTL
jgi:hypothetical protein